MGVEDKGHPSGLSGAMLGEAGESDPSRGDGVRTYGRSG
jgi:hypothetical protein